jgi:hypothetical protein
MNDVLKLSWTMSGSTWRSALGKIPFQRFKTVERVNLKTIVEAEHLKYRATLPRLLQTPSTAGKKPTV